MPRIQVPHAPMSDEGLLLWAKKLVAWMNIELTDTTDEDDMWDEYGIEVESTTSPIVAIAAPPAPKKRTLLSLTVACPAVAVGAALDVTLVKKKDTTSYEFHYQKVYDELSMYLPEGARQILDADDESIEVIVANNPGTEMVSVTGVYGESRT